MRRLHLGGKVRVDGWEVLDAVPGPQVDHLGDARDLSRFPDGTFDVLYGSHILEHFDYKDALLPVLKEWHRVLKPGGTLHVSVPDMDVLCRLFLDRRLDTNARFQVMRMMFGGHIDQYDYHLVGFNEEFLSIFLQQAGFNQLTRVPRFGLFQDTSDMEVAGEPISVNVTAVRG